jgi:hypothetical protein
VSFVDEEDEVGRLADSDLALQVGGFDGEGDIAALVFPFELVGGAARSVLRGVHH